MRIVELILDEDSVAGIEAISIVENPAIEEDFIALNSRNTISRSRQRQANTCRCVVSP